MSLPSGTPNMAPQLQGLTIICHDGSSTIHVAVPQTIYGELRRAPDKQEFLRNRV